MGRAIHLSDQRCCDAPVKCPLGHHLDEYPDVWWCDLTDREVPETPVPGRLHPGRTERLRPTWCELPCTVWGG